LEGVNYIFLDEVSMLSCKDMYKISAKLALALSMPHLPFGGMNMIFAGDFGQLPPAIGGESVALYSHSIGQSPKSRSDQENAIGQHLWHQVTTVVMLRKNMRQTETSENDDNY
jgi:ATP-dependent DNA helicase PIF1